MNIQLIKNDSNLINTAFIGDNILETKHSDNQAMTYELLLYDPHHAHITVVAPKINKYDCLPVYNCIYNSEDIYFASFEPLNDEKIAIIVYKYDIRLYKAENILTFEERNILDNEDLSIKIFIVSDNYIIVQSEYIKKENDELMGNIEFSQMLYNLDSGESFHATNINLINNGINTIVPVSETHFMVKSGFSSMEDSRINPSSENEALIESIYYCSISMFISSLSIDNATVGYSLLGTAYFETSILKAGVVDDYIYFSIYDHKNKNCETTFYNYKNDETIKCVNNDVPAESSFNAYVIDNTPYIKNCYQGRTEFFNVTTSESDCVFYNEDFIALSGTLFIFKDRSNDNLRVYRYPDSHLVFTGKGNLINVINSCDNYYLYINYDKQI